MTGEVIDKGFSGTCVAETHQLRHKGPVFV